MKGKLSENTSGTVTREEVINLNCKILDLTIKINNKLFKTINLHMIINILSKNLALSLYQYGNSLASKVMVSMQDIYHL